MVILEQLAALEKQCGAPLAIPEMGCVGVRLVKRLLSHFRLKNLHNCLLLKINTVGHQLQLLLTQCQCLWRRPPPQDGSDQQSSAVGTSVAPIGALV